MVKPQVPQKLGRRSRRSELDELIQVTGRQMIAANGLDETSAALLADAVGTSIGPIYARYDTIEDLAVELWRTEVRDAFGALLALTRSSSAGDLAARSELAALLVAPDETLQVLVEILGVARRYPFLREVVTDDLAGILQAHFDAQPDVPGAVALVQAHVVLGAIFLAPVGSAMSVADFFEVLELTAVFTNDLEARDHSRVEAAPSVFPLPDPTTGDALLDAFTEAVLEVVAQVGYAKASANRIARRAGHGFSTIYSHFETKDEFMETTINLLIDQIIGSSVSGFIGVGRDEFIASSVANARGMLSESHRLNRHLRTEVVLAARHHPVISDHMNAAYEVILSFGRNAYAQAYPNFSDEHAPALKALWLIVRSQGFGLSLLRSNTAVATEFEWTPCAVGLWNLTNNSLLTHLA